MYQIYQLLLICCLFITTHAMDGCTQQTSCSSCHQAFPECAWCSDPQWAEYRCYSKGAFYIKGTCKDEQYIESSISVTAEAPLNDVIQVFPQKLSVHLRPRMPVTQKVVVRPMAGYPIDTYYLMDFSYSMKNDLETLRSLAANLTEEFRRVSEDYTLGLGTFIDKNTSPMSYTEPTRKANPCYNTLDSNSKCSESYSFKHEMDLSSSMNNFTEMLGKLEVSSNIDTPEGGFDALMQVASCQNILGFRNNSRKIVIYMSDQGLHIAGDGKLAGIFKPNDGNCYMEGGEYKAGLDMDYPSIEQINRKLIEKDLIPIFAVGEHVIEKYQKLSDQLTQLSQVGTITEDSSNLVQVVRRALDRITTTINLVILDAIGINATITPLCNKRGGMNSCKDVKFGQSVEFNITFSFETCDDSTPKERIIPIIVTGFSTVLVHVTTQCECDCNIDPYHESCFNNGNLTCGACDCNGEYFGQFCECDNTFSKPDTTCKSVSKVKQKKMTGKITGKDKDLMTLETVCSNEGSCVCGECDCRQPETPPYETRPYVLYGKYCECNNYECARGSNGKICSGEGFCDCGQCNCNVTNLGRPRVTAEFGGDACGCKISTAECISPGGEIEGETCSGNGECECGKCVCDSKHRGRYCQICDLCGPLNCQNHIDCVLCRMLKYDPDNNVLCNEACTGLDMEKYKVTENIDLAGMVADEKEVKSCGDFNDNDTDCVVRFYLVLTNQTDPLTMTTTIDYDVYIDAVVYCDDKLRPVWMVMAIVSALLLPCMFGLVMWKLYVGYHDKREYERFEEQMKNTNWTTTESPLYRQACTTYNNPIFQKNIYTKKNSIKRTFSNAYSRI